MDEFAAAREFFESIPHHEAMGIKLVSLANGKARVKLEIEDHLLGDTERGVVHGGVITVLLDTVSGISVFSRTAAAEPIATLDLRIDYLKPSSRGGTLFAEAECYHASRNVAFTRAIAFHDLEDPIAHAAGTFLRGTAGSATLGGPARGKAAGGGTENPGQD